jgi:hypothetical protein
MSIDVMASQVVGSVLSKIDLSGSGPKTHPLVAILRLGLIAFLLAIAFPRSATASVKTGLFEFIFNHSQSSAKGEDDGNGRIHDCQQMQSVNAHVDCRTTVVVPGVQTQYHVREGILAANRVKMPSYTARDDGAGGTGPLHVKLYTAMV